MAHHETYACIVGSRAFGLEIEHSDTDVFRIDNGTVPPPISHGHYYTHSPQQALLQFLGEVPSASLRLLAAMFPASSSGGALAEYLQRERERIVRHTRSRYYTASMHRADIFRGHSAEHAYRTKRSDAGKFLMYAVFLYSVISEYAAGKPMDECLRPSGDFRRWLLGVRNGEVPFAEVLQKSLALRREAAAVREFWMQPGNEEYIEQARRDLQTILRLDRNDYKEGTIL